MIDALVDLLCSTYDDKTRRQVEESLGKIDPNNEKTIDALVLLLEFTSNNYTRLIAAKSLEKIGKGNQKTIDAFVHLLGSTYDDKTRGRAAHSLEKIGTGNDKANERAIDGLLHLLGSTSETWIQVQAAKSLEKIGKGNQKAINGLLHLSESASGCTTFVQLTLEKIGKGNQKAIDDLVHLLGSSSDDYTRKLTAQSLWEILAEKQVAEVVTSLKDYLSVKGYRDSSDRFYKCYGITWNCAEMLPYQEFYQAWHRPVKSKKLRWLFWCLCFLLGLVVVFILT